MKELRFHKDLYHGESVDSALQVYARYAEITTAEENDYWVVRIEASSPAREQRIGDEMANYALGLTIREGAHR
ncbi:MAG: HxsD-like protein [Myxococcales bacterium]|nr:HxsD-like protein [Myxococcales bacterium]